MTEVNDPPVRPARHLTPVTVVVGGAEAALLASRLGGGLAAAVRAERVAVIAETEAPEDVGSLVWLVVDAIEGERTLGCPCCRARLDLVRAVRLLVERPQPVDRVIVLVDPRRDASIVTQTILAEPELQRLVDLDGVVATVHAPALATRLALGMPFGSDLELQRLAVADRIVVHRAGDVVDDALGAILRILRTVNRFGYFAAPSIAPIDLATLVDLRAWHGAPTIAPHQLAEPFVAPDGRFPVTVHCEVHGPLDPEAIDEWFDRVIAQHGPQLLRLQGAVSVRGQQQRICCRGVHSFALSHDEDEHPAGQRSDRSVVALVGSELDAATLRDDFAATRAR